MKVEGENNKLTLLTPDNTGVKFLIILCLLLGIVFVPLYLNLTYKTRTAVVTAIAGSLSSLNATNYALRSLHTGNGKAVMNCNSIPLLLKHHGLPDGYYTNSQLLKPHQSSTCTLTGPQGITTDFIGTGIN